MLSRLATFTVVCAVPLVLAACVDRSASDPRTEAPLVRVASLHTEASSSRVFTGTVAARVQSDLGFRVAGEVVVRLVNA
ncbi:MAG: efflux RND transporter periplasmic adaptor subunit, partial [Gammaproteobacteria bacterium]